jgi:tetratricopeptide (TPR) repeat protein
MADQELEGPEHSHLTPEELDRLLAVDRTAEQNRNLFHQIAVCPGCREAGGYLLDLFRSGALPLRFGLVELALARSRAEAPDLWRRLEPLSPEERLRLVRADPTFASWGLCELLCRESRRTAPGDAGLSIHLGELAVTVADALGDGGPAEDRWLYQLRAHAWAHLGNAHRAQGDLRGADEAFNLSDQWYGAGEESVGDSLGYGPAILDLKASLRRDQRRFAEALVLVDQAVAEYLGGDPDCRDPHLAGRTLVTKSYVLSDLGETESTISTLREAERLVDPTRDPRLLLCIRHNLLDNLTKAGRYGEAETLLAEVRTCCRDSGTSLDAIRLTWVEGRIAAGLGRTEEARRTFEEIRHEFTARDMAYDAALVTLELAALYIEEGRTSEVRDLAREMIEVFRAQDVHREALAALAVFHSAAVLETATVELAREIAARLEQERRRGSGPREIS